MRHSQRGVTFLGWIILLIPIAIVVYAGILLTPSYLNYMRVARAMTQMASEARGADTSNVVYLRTSLEKRWDIEGIEKPTTKDVDLHRDGDHWVAIVDYEDLAPMFGNVSLLVQFHKEVTVE